MKKFFVVLFYLIGTYCGCQAQLRPRPCNIAVRCSDEEKPVSATTNGLFCDVFRNDCILFSRNCSLLNENKPTYTKITTQQCRQLCRELVCLAVFQPVCGIYNNRLRTFGNDCEMSRRICSTQETWSLYRAGACPR
ncbi:U-Kazal-Dg21.2-like [Episyrphus balteatus]|uniref:U-Kazal-Dg21.2-like n=1 Tax=Episyrphus balteatus TaxID=286459 RepID=UPI002486B707|nr:U-Kazal-Dg21.2-like [Episyrphus balteatus]